MMMMFMIMMMIMFMIMMRFKVIVCVRFKMINGKSLITKQLIYALKNRGDVWLSVFLRNHR